MNNNLSAGIHTALVTGGNRGIGLAICRLLATNGIRVMLASRNREAGEIAAQALRDEGLPVTALTLDVASSASIQAACAQLEAEDIAVDILVNNAGVLHEGTLLDLPDNQLAESLAVHLTGPLDLIRRLAPGMVRRGQGRIVNLSSEWGSFASGLGGPEAYGITKAALNALTIRLARELPPCIKINAMDPGWVRTRMGGEHAPDDPAKAARTALWLATLPEDGPNGGFFRNLHPAAW